MLTRLFEGPIDQQAVLLAVALTIVVAWIAARLVRRLAGAGLHALGRDSPAASGAHVRGSLRLLGGATFVLVFGVLLFPAFQIAGLRPRTGIALRSLAEWMFGRGLHVLLIAILAYAFVRMAALLALRFEHDMTVGTGLDAIERGKRARTLSAVVQNFAKVLIIGIAALMVLKEFQLDITPILTGAGIVGLAVGFGAQTLVRDIISGFFLILENQVRVGDEAAINGTPGLVEAINLRTIVLRDIEGTVHVFPNGAINTLANRSKDFSYYVLDLAVSYYDDSDLVADVLREIGADAAEGSRSGLVNPGTDRDPGDRRVRRVVGQIEGARQDRAVATVASRPRAAAPRHQSVPATRLRDSVPRAVNGRAADPRAGWPTGRPDGRQ